MEGDDRAKYLFLSLLQARVGSSLVSHLGNLAPEAVLRTPVVELAGLAKISERASRAIEELQRTFDPGRMQDRLAAKGIEALTPVDEAYPGSLRSIPDPPPAVFVNGAVPDTVSVALVGSRKASATGIETARALGLALSERGVCVVSGLALGVDAAAHEGAVEAGGPTVGVLGCGIDVTYPTKYKRARAALSRPALRVLRGTIRINEGLAEPCTLSHSSRFGEPFSLATSDLQRNRRHVIHELPTPFDPMLKKAQLPPIRLHDLMHACATILLTAGEYPKFVQELLDHASINITLDTYSHIMEGMDGGLADVMDRAP